MGKVKVVVLASGRGSNFGAIMAEIAAGRCDAEVKALITNNPDAPAIGIAKTHSIPVELIDKKSFKTREALDDRILEILRNRGAELVVLAGYMLLLKSRKLLQAYKNHIINIHPSLVPSFPGEDAQKKAFEYGCKVSGLTIHFVDESLDGGPILYQEAVDISTCRGAEEVSAKILERERKAYPKVIDSFSKGKYEVEGRRVRYTQS
jgi:phosphoribosylglycinamide formyltransferase-1